MGQYRETARDGWFDMHARCRQAAADSDGRRSAVALRHPSVSVLAAAAVASTA